jgi:ligand-binding sensor protein
MEIQKMLDDFCDLTGLAAVITDEYGNMLTNVSNITCFCLIMRKQGNLCCKSDEEGGKIAAKTGKICMYKCHAGIIDFAVPIFIGKEHVGNILTGQVKTDATLSMDLTKTNLHTLNYDTKTLISYFEDIPYMEQEKLEKCTKILEIIRKYLVNHIKLNRINKENKLQTEQISIYNDFKLRSEMIVDCVKNVKYDVGKNLIIELIDDHICRDCSKLNKSLYKNIFYYEMKSLDIDLQDINNFDIRENMNINSYDYAFFLKIYDYVFDYVLSSKFFKVTNKMDYATSYIQRYSNKKITSKDIARYMNLSPDYFCKIFKKQFGQSVMDYIIGYKIGIAKKKLIHSDLSIIEISVDLGFSDSNYFSRVFKKKVGVSPNTYRMNNSSLLIDYVNKITE